MTPPSGDPPRLEPPATRFDVLATVGIVVCAAAFAFGPRLAARLGAHATTAECDELLAHYVELLARVDEVTKPSEREQRQAKARTLAASHEAFLECPRMVTREQLSCAQHAHDADVFERCLP